MIHVPHASVWVPDDVRACFQLSGAELERELLAMTDRYTDELFVLPPEMAQSVVYGVSRLVVDPERFVDDDVEPMARKGMGVIYTCTSDRRVLRATPSPGERRDLLQRFYFPHHQRLGDAVDAALEAHAACLIVDGHSFPSRALAYEDDPDAERPEVCVGTNPLHTPAWLREAAVAAFKAEGFRVALNTPFAGAIVPEKHTGKDLRVGSVMIEVNRALYMDEASGAWLPRAADLRTRLRRALGVLVATHAEHARA